MAHCSKPGPINQGKSSLGRRAGTEYNGRMSKPAANLTPDWPYDMAQVIRQMGLRRRGEEQCTTILALALRALGHDAHAVRRPAQSTASKENPRTGRREEAYTKERPLCGVELDGLFLSSHLLRSWDETLLRMHQDLGKGVDPDHDWETVFTGAIGRDGTTAPPDVIERAAAAMQASPTAGYVPHVASPHPDAAIMAESRKILFGLFDPSNLDTFAKKVACALQAQDIPAQVWRQVETEERGGVLHEIHTQALRYGSPATSAYITDGSMPGAVRCITPAKGGLARHMAPGECLQTSEWNNQAPESRSDTRCAGLITLLLERHLQTHIATSAPATPPRPRM